MVERESTIRNPKSGRQTTRHWIGQLSLSTWTLIGLIAGVGTGIFLGEYCSILSILGDAFVALLQMTILPYIIVSLISNLGRLSWQQSRRLAKFGGAVLLILWVIALATVFWLAQIFPDWHAGSFYSTSVVDSSDEIDIVSLFIPSNIFQSLTNNHIPAVVFLCICVGLGLSTTNERDRVVSLLDVLANVLIRISKSIANLTPLGVFAISASTAGTIQFGDLGRLQAYVICHTTGAIFLGLVVVPGLVAVLTPFAYRDVVSVARNGMLTAFATGKLIIVLPLLIEETERLFEQYELSGDPEVVPAVDVLYPVAYPFPHIGKLLGILFVPFVAWFLGSRLPLIDYPVLLSSGLFSYFGGPNLAMPFLLNTMHLPRDMFQLFLMVGVYEGRVSDAVGAMHLVGFSLLSATAFLGRLQFVLSTFLKYVTIVLLLGVVLSIVLSASLQAMIDPLDNRQEIIAGMQLLDNPTQATISRSPEPNPVSRIDGESLIDRIRRRGVIRIGYNEDKRPFAFFNIRDELVGFDVDMAHALAHDLHVSIEFVPFDRKTLAQQLRDDHFDIVMSGLVGTLERSETMQHTEPYMDLNLGLVVPDHMASHYRTLKSLRRIKGLRIGFVDLSRGFVARLREALPDAELVELSTNQEYFGSAHDELDALLISAENGFAYTLLNPNYEVVIPTDLRVKLPLFYAISAWDAGMKDLLEHWVSLRRKDGTVKKYYDHWILGKTTGVTDPRWCVIRDVLHWVH
ncbi:MAG: Na+/H+-dicarboxylate symporter/ABC-type amino acid transport substrate-binding protein [Pirellulaceae bacterium]|jgi:Na+/H+-dicarboxylate symporter/ABC-type amino acid transport substrate-binding protein